MVPLQRALEQQACLRCQPEQLFAHRGMAVPFARIPYIAAHIVAAIEQLGKLDAAKLGDSEESRRFHLDGQTALCAATLYFAPRLTVGGISGPGFSLNILGIVLLERCFDGCHSCWIRCNLARWWEIVIRGALVADGAGWDNDMSKYERPIEHASTAAGNKLATSQRADLFEEGNCERCADPWMDDGQALSMKFQFINRICTDFAFQVFEHAHRVALRKLGNHILKEADNSVFRNIYRL